MVNKEATRGKTALLKTLCVVLAIILMAGIATIVALTVHDAKTDAQMQKVENGLSAYELAVENGYEGTLQEWLESLSGKSAYEIAVENGYKGTEAEWNSALASLSDSASVSVKTASFNEKGELVLTLSDDTTVNIGKAQGINGVNGKDGADGKDGANGKDGTNGKDGANGKDGIGITNVDINDAGELILLFSNNQSVNVGKVVGTAGVAGPKGENGLSAYEIAVMLGKTTAATEAEWIESLKGEKGDTGATGAQGEKGDKGDKGDTGATGTAGLSAYEIAQANGVTLSEQEWLESLKGEKGETGAAGQNGLNGKSAYEIAKFAGLTTAATEAEWIESLKGEKGDTGATGAQGQKGDKGEDGIAPQVRINSTTNEWEISVDEGSTWTTTGVKATGEKGDKGDTGANGAQGEKGDKGDTGATGAQGQKGDKGEDGIAPQVRINSTTNEWEISVDEGSTWTTTGVKATGEKGEKGDAGATGAQGEKGDKGDKGDTGATGAQGEKGDKGDTGATGAAGQNGLSAYELAIKNGLTTAATEAEWLESLKGSAGAKGDKGDTGATGSQGIQGEKGDKGDTGAQGEQGVGIQNIEISNGTMTITLTNNKVFTFENVIGGSAQGSTGKDGVSPKIRINASTNEWEISTDNGATWTTTGVKATGEKGDKGDTGATGAQGIQGEKGDKGDTGATGATGAQGDKGEDGIAPQIRINATTNEWEISVDEGNTWSSTGVKAIGEKGDKGDTGATGAQGEQGEKGEKGDKGDTGATGAKGDKGDAGVGVTGVSINEDNYLVITLSEGDPIVLEQSIVGEKGDKGDKGEKGDKGDKGEAGATGATGNGIQSVTLTADFKLVITMTDGSSTTLGPIRGEKGEKGDTGATGAQGIQGEKGDKGDTGADGLTPYLSLDADGNLSVKYGENGTATILGCLKGEKGDKGDKGDTGATGAQGPKGDAGATGAQGPKGDAGATGAQGPQGATGEKGDKGDPGRGILKTEISGTNWIIYYTDGTTETHNLSGILGGGSGTVTPTTYTVTFKDWDGRVIDTQTVESGKAAIAPADPSRTGYVFTGWDKSFSSITTELIVTAQYQQVTSPTIMVSNVTATAGQSVQVPVVIMNNPGVAGAKITMSFDSALTLSAASSGEAFSYLQYTKPGKFVSPCNFTWDSESGMATENGTILIMTFDIPADAVAGDTYTITCTSKAGYIYDEDLDDVTFEIISGVITVG